MAKKGCLSTINYLHIKCECTATTYIDDLSLCSQSSPIIWLPIPDSHLAPEPQRWLERFPYEQTFQTLDIQCSYCPGEVQLHLNQPLLPRQLLSFQCFHYCSQDFQLVRPKLHSQTRPAP